jgi:glycosyltransferase involved in cell wall biosynthesis
MLLTVIIPVYNESGTIAQVVERVLQAPFDKQILIVDDGSRDDSRQQIEKIQAPGVEKIFHERNMGKGAAIRTAWNRAKGDVILIQDADLEYDPSDYEALLQPILQDKADVVFGSRFVGGYPHRVLYFWHSLGNNLLTLLANMLNDLNLSDMETGYKVFTREVRDKFHISSNRFGFEPEFTARVAKHHFRIYEVPISYHGRTYKEGKKITWRDGFAALFWIFRYRFFN